MSINLSPLNRIPHLARAKWEFTLIHGTMSCYDPVKFFGFPMRLPRMPSVGLPRGKYSSVTEILKRQKLYTILTSKHTVS